MKFKTMAVLAVSGLMAASLAYVLPAFAEEAYDDIDGSASMQLAMGDEADSAADSNAATDSSAPASDSGAAPADKASDASSTNGSSSSSSSNDQGTPDVASGDDDY